MRILTYDAHTPQSLKDAILNTENGDTESALNAIFILTGIVRDLQVKVNELKDRLYDTEIDVARVEDALDNPPQSLRAKLRGDR